MKTVSLNLRVDEYSNRVLEVIKAVYGLSNKSEALEKLVHEAGGKLVEPELQEEFAAKVISETKAWERKHEFKRKTNLAELNDM